MIVCFAAVLSVSAFAANIDDYAFIADDGSMQYDMDAYHYAVAQEMVLDSGIDIDPSLYFLRDPVTGDFCGYDFNSFLNDYDFAVAAMNPPLVSENVEPLEPAAPPLEVETEIEVETDRAVLSDVLEDDEVVSVQDVEVDEPHRYVVEDLRSPPVDPSFVTITPESDFPYYGIWIKISDVCPSPSELSSAVLSIYQMGEYGEVPLLEISPVIESYNAYIYGEAFLIIYEKGFFAFKDLDVGFYVGFTPEYLIENEITSLSIHIPNYTGFGGDSMNGTLKSLIVSIFGEYKPVYTTALLTETVDNVTTTTLIDVVASGMAGVDWEWCAGVFLFGIMLFCLFKLLGGILS